MMTTARFTAAQPNAGRKDRFEIGSIDRKFGMRRMAFTLSALCFVQERRPDAGYVSPSTSRELKPSPLARRQMCGVSHIELGATGTRLSQPVPHEFGSKPVRYAAR
jgi:hypothetical protein